MRKRSFSLKAERHFKPAENASSNQDNLGENALEDASRIRSLHNKRDRSSAQDVKIIDLHDLKVALTTQKRVRMEKSTTHRNIIARTRKSHWMAPNSNSIARQVQQRLLQRRVWRKRCQRRSKAIRHATESRRRILANGTFWLSRPSQ